MSWLNDTIKRWLGWRWKKQPDERMERLNSILQAKETLAVQAKGYSDRTDDLNRRFKSVMAASDAAGLENLKIQFQLLNDAVLRSRREVNGRIQDLRQLQLKLDNPAILEALDEFSEIIKAFNIILKHHKAIQHFRITGEKSETVRKPAGKPPVRSALDSMQSQQTVLIQLPKDLLNPPESRTSEGQKT